MMSPSQVLGPEAAAEINHVLLADEMIQWFAYIPENYSPKRPPGVIVYVPSAGRSSVPNEWRPLMDDRNLIWIGPNKGGAGVPVQERVLKAIFAPHVIGNRYTVDEERVYIAGFADGGKVANLVQSADPGTFKGGLHICGALFWDENTPNGLDLIRANRHVFIRSGCPGTKEREVSPGPRRVRRGWCSERQLYFLAGTEIAGCPGHRTSRRRSTISMATPWSPVINWTQSTAVPGDNHE